jgi:predicted HTH transcriptional regulator
VAENKTIEHKLPLPGNSENNKKEFYLDVSSFSNASGGDVICGIEKKGLRTVNRQSSQK